MKRFIPLVVLLLIGIAALIYLPGISKYLKLKHREAGLDREIERLERQIENLKEEEHLLKNDLARLEEVVRDELGLVKPGEIVYKVVEEEVVTGAKQ